MYEQTFFKIGITVGYLLIWMIMATICLGYYIVMEKRWNKFLLVTKQHQKYKEWESKLKSPYKIVKNNDS